MNLKKLSNWQLVREIYDLENAVKNWQVVREFYTRDGHLINMILGPEGLTRREAQRIARERNQPMPDGEEPIWENGERAFYFAREVLR